MLLDQHLCHIDAAGTRVEGVRLKGDYVRPHALRDYALLADGERGAVVGPRGEIVWLCAPRWDDDAVFGCLVGGGGQYSVSPKDRFVWGGYYEPGTLIWHSRWITDDGPVECREALAFPGDPHSLVLLRSVIAGNSPARVRVGTRSEDRIRPGPASLAPPQPRLLDRPPR